MPVASGLGDEREGQLRVLADLRATPAEPAKDSAEAIERRSDRLRIPLDEVEVLREPRCGRKVQLVERCTAPKGEVLAEEPVGEDVTQSAREEEVLLHVVFVGPRRVVRPPGQDLAAGQHQSGSIESLMTIRQRRLRMPARPDPGTSGTQCSGRPSIQRWSGAALSGASSHSSR